MCMIDDVESCTWFGTELRKARKQHRCAECRRDIEPSEQYAYSTYLDDGGAFCVNKACAHCHAAREWLVRHCGGWVTEALVEELAEHFASDYRVDGLARLYVGARRKWRGFNGRPLMTVPSLVARASSSPPTQESGNG